MEYLKVNNKDTRRDKRNRRSGTFIVNFEHVSINDFEKVNVCWVTVKNA